MAASQLAFHLTDRCQLDCRHCLRDPAREVLDLPVDLIDSVLEQARCIYRSEHVSLTGGEPTIHPRFADVLDAVVRHGMTWNVVTNGGRFERFTELLAADPRRREALSLIDFSLDGADEATHDAIRGAGSFREVMAAVARCTALGLPFVLQMAVNAVNVGQLEQYGMLASQLGAVKASFAMMVPTGTRHDADLRLPESGWRAVRDRLLRLQETLRLPIVLCEGFPVEQPFHLCQPFKSETLHVDPRGRLSLCCALSGVPGGDGAEVLADLRTTSLADAHRQMLEVIHRAQLAQLAVMEKGPLTGWDRFPCNHCAKYFGKPHWTDEGAAGPRARRQRTGGPDRPDGGKA